MSQPKKLSGKVAIVTASTNGIGFAIAQRLAEDGASVMISSRRQKNIDRAVDSLKKKGLNVDGTVCHVANKENMIQKTVAEFGGIDILVSNAAVNPIMGPIFETTEDAWDKIMEVNVKATFFLCKEVVPYIEKRRLVAMATEFPHRFIMGKVKFMGPYAISKTALLSMVKAMVPECAERNIRINGLAPGVIETKFSEPLWKNDVARENQQNIPLSRYGKSEECAGIVSMLVSDDASYITGENIVVAGGAASRL